MRWFSWDWNGREYEGGASCADGPEPEGDGIAVWHWLAPGQEAVIQLLSQLYHANLLQYENAADSAQLFERFKKRREREVRSRLAMD